MKYCRFKRVSTEKILAGSWTANRDAEEIIHNIKKNRINSNKLSEGF